LYITNNIKEISGVWKGFRQPAGGK